MRRDAPARSADAKTKTVRRSAAGSRRLPAALAVCVAAVFSIAAPATAAAACPNEAFRGGASSHLPECRAYEMVTPPDKANGDVETRTFLVSRGVAGLDETGYAFLSLNGLPGSENGALASGNVAKRGSDGWTSFPFAAPTVNHDSVALQATSLLLSRDLNQAVISSLAPLTPDSQPGENLYVRTLSPPSLQLMTPTPIPVEGNFYTLQASNLVGASDDFSRIIFQSKARLTPDSAELSNISQYVNLYEWDGSELTNIGILPEETEPTSTGLQGGLAVSPDGQRVIFKAPSSKIFLRDRGTTIDPALPAPGVVDPGGSLAVYAGGSRDLSVIFFRSTANLTTDAFTGENSSGQKHLAPNLYRYDVENDEIVDLTVNPTHELGANVNGQNVVVSPNGQAAFFVAGGVMAPGATLGASNLYRWSADEGIEFIVTLNPSDPFVANSVNIFSSEEGWTDNTGDTFAFVSVGALTGESPVGVRQLYRWSESEGLTCVSCAPAVASPAGMQEPAASIRGGTGSAPLSPDGSKVYFSTTDRLVAGDTNGKLDVYQWANGEVDLISTGSGDFGAEFLAASPSTKDVFFVTRDRLVAADRDENTDVYDAREGGGFPEPPLSVPCEGEACRSPLEAGPPAPPVASRSFDGPSNPKPAARKKKRCGKKAGKRNAHTKKCKRKSPHGRTTGKRG